MVAIQVNNLKKYYQIYKKEPGLTGSFKSFFNRKYEDIKAVDGISFNIEEGELIGFIGPNGAGKTTTLKCLTGLLYPTSGEVSVLGYEPFKRNYKFLRQISLVMGQKNQLWWDLPPMESFLLNKEIYGIPDGEFKKGLNDLVSLLDASEFLEVPVKKLSLGQRMKCELISSLIHKPKMLFLDEPTIGLDVVMQKNLRDFIKQYNKTNNATVILTSHYMIDVETLCKRVIIINHGKVLFDGKLANLVRRYADEKLISVILKKEIDVEKIGKIAEVKKYKYPELVLSVPSEKISVVTSKLLDILKIDDLNIEEQDVEGVIRKIFMGANK